MEDWEIKKTLNEISINGIVPNEKQLELFRQYHLDLERGIAKENSDARTILIIANERLIKKVCKDIIYGFVDFGIDSMIYSDAKLWLIKAVDTFNPDLNINFSTHAYWSIKTGVHRYFQEQRRAAKRTPIEEQLSTMRIGTDDKSREFEIADDYCLNEDVTTKLDCEIQRKKLVNFFKYLTENEQDVLINYYGLFGKSAIAGYRYAKIISISPETARERLAKAITKLQLLFKTQPLSEDEVLKLRKIKKSTFSYIPEIQRFIDSNNYDVVSL